MSAAGRPLYRHAGVAMLRAAAVPVSRAPARWPDPDDAEGCRAWLRDVWADGDLAEAIRLASPVLAASVDAICGSDAAPVRRVRRATRATIRYLLRATGRHTPFGLFAGVAPVRIGTVARADWGERNRTAARVDTQWLADVVARLEACPQLQDRLDVVLNSLAVERGGRLEVPLGQNRVTVRLTSAVRAVREASAVPIRFDTLAGKLGEAFPGAGKAAIRRMLGELVRQGFLITCLRGPLTVTDPLGHVLDRLRDADAAVIPEAAPIVRELQVIQAGMQQLHHGDQVGGYQALAGRMRLLSSADRAPLAVDLRVDCDVELPGHVVEEMERAATALIRLTRHPTGEAPWREFYAAFCERYGTGTLVPLVDVVHPDAGLGFPHGYPGSVLPRPSSAPSARDERLLTLAWQAMTDGSREVVLNDGLLALLTAGDGALRRPVPPHVELAARIHATSTAALDRGEYTLVVAPARSAGTFTSRFAGLVPDLVGVYQEVPVAVESALPVQLSFPPAYPHAENVCRVHAYLPHVLALGEHRGHGEYTIPIEDLAVTATREGLHLVSIARQRAIEPQVFHALALDKQAPPLARLLAHLPRAFGPAWHEFDWGPHAQRLPFLPRVRYRRAVLSPARWRLNAGDLAAPDSADQVWREALDRWRRRWRCPDLVELHDADRTLRMNLTEPAHLALLHVHVRRHGDAVLSEAATDGVYGWIGGHAHEVVVPLFSTLPAATPPRVDGRRLTLNARHGHLPGGPGAAWLSAKLFTHPERMDELLAGHLPQLGGEGAYWFVRYRSRLEPDHLRLRIRTPGGDHGRQLAAATSWAQQLRDAGLIGRLAFDTYYPETGRYGDGAAMAAAEEVFVADSTLVSAQLRHQHATAVQPTALAAMNMIGTVNALLGDAAAAMHWLAGRPPATADPLDRDLVREVVRWIGSHGATPPARWEPEPLRAWQARDAALHSYRSQLPPDADIDTILEALLHMHHNRALGLDRDDEANCRRLARQAALTWIAQHPEQNP